MMLKCISNNRERSICYQGLVLRSDYL
uniref:Uncharacterized protein n=1 Tax=Rhizophora mucronata TaxID=61149 RepID=A0A2P2QJA2_RHIMU